MRLSFGEMRISRHGLRHDEDRFRLVKVISNVMRRLHVTLGFLCDLGEFTRDSG